MEKKPKSRPASTADGRELQIANAAYDLAERQILEGTAKPSVIVHFLKIASPKERLEREILEKERDMLVAKTEALKSEKRIEELYANALDAMRLYSGEQSHGKDEMLL